MGAPNINDCASGVPNQFFDAEVPALGLTLVALAGTVSVTNNSASITFSTAQSLTAGTIFVFAEQPNVYYTLSATINAATSATLSAVYTGVTNGTTTTTAATSLAGTVTVTLGSTTVTFSVAQTLPAGAVLLFSASGQYYQLASAVNASTTGTLTTAYTSATNSSGWSVVGTGDYVPTKAGGVARGLFCTSPGTALVDCYGLKGPGSGITNMPIQMASGQQIQLAITKIHQVGTSGNFIALY